MYILSFRMITSRERKYFVLNHWANFTCVCVIFFQWHPPWNLEEAKAVIEETRALRCRIHLAEAAQRQARGMETDYEEVIRLLEAEITELKAQLADYSDQNKVSKAVPSSGYHGSLAVVMYPVFIFFSSALLN